MLMRCIAILLVALGYICFWMASFCKNAIWSSLVSRMPLIFKLGVYGYILLNLCLEPCSFCQGSNIHLSSWMFSLHATLWRSLSFFFPQRHFMYHAWSLWVICCLWTVWSCLGHMLMRGEIMWKVSHCVHGNVTCLYVPFYLVGDARAQIVSISLVYVTTLACCSFLCIFDKHMLAFVDLIHELPTRGRKVPNSCFQGESCIKGRKIGRNAFVRGELAFMHLGAHFRLNFSCSLLPMVSSPFASPWGVDNFGAFYLSCVEPLPFP
jgi:hypothetical protein